MNIGCIGSGNMATALIKGFISSKKVCAEDITVSDKNPDNLKKWLDSGVKTAKDNASLCETSDIIIYAVKPDVLPFVLEETKTAVKSNLVVSIAAGVSIKTIEEILGKDAKIVRAMPNTPAQVGCGMTVLSPNKSISSSEADRICDLFAAAGDATILDEKYINAATALHGSSPAYVYMMIEAMANSGVKHGIPKNISLKLAAKAVEGAAKMVLETNIHPSELKDAVCSPGGTTIAAVMELEKGGYSATISAAVDACVKKAEEMAAK